MTCMQPLRVVASSIGIQAVTCSTSQLSGCKYPLSCSNQTQLQQNSIFDSYAHERIPLSTLPKSFKCSCTPLLSLVDVRHV